MKRLGGGLAPLGVLAGLLAGCSSNGLGVTLSGDTHQATASGVSCDPGSTSVTVSGSFTPAPGAFAGRGPARPITLPDGRRVLPRYSLVSIGPSATIYDGAGHQIGAFNGPDVSLRANKVTPFRFVVPVLAGSPAACALSWSAGPAPVLGE
jgi:hypothetical protein